MLNTGLKSISSVVKTKQYSHTYWASTKGNGILSPSLVSPIYRFCDPCKITVTRRSFLIWEAEMTVCLDYSIVESKRNNACESTLHTTNVINAMLQAHTQPPLASSGISFTEKSPQLWGALLRAPRRPVSNSSPPVPEAENVVFFLIALDSLFFLF